MSSPPRPHPFRRSSLSRAFEGSPRALWRRLHERGARLAHGAFGPVIEALFPAVCPSCERPLPGLSRGGICAACWAAIRPVLSPLCPRCGIPSGAPFPGAPRVDRVCIRCQRRPPTFDGARCALVFEGTVRTLLHLFKFDDRRDLAGVLARALLVALPAEETFDLAVPVPLHWTRRLARGYNQAALLARQIARARGIAPGLGLLVKTRRTPDQAHLGAAARRENVRGSFAVREALPWTARRRAANGARPLEGLRILLVDDILTTGATAEACARALKRAGAAYVFVLAVARTPLGGSGAPITPRRS